MGDEDPTWQGGPRAPGQPGPVRDGVALSSGREPGAAPPFPSGRPSEAKMILVFSFLLQQKGKESPGVKDWLLSTQCSVFSSPCPLQGIVPYSVNSYFNPANIWPTL